MIKYVVSALCGVITTGLSVGVPIYTRFVAMETTMSQLTVVVKELSTKVHELKIEMVELQTTNNLLNYEVREKIK